MKPSRPTAILHVSCALSILAACSQPIDREAPPPADVVASAPDASPLAVAEPATDATPRTGWSFAPRTAATDAGWYPIHDGVTVALSDDGAAMEVRYRRASGSAAGVAFDLAPGSCAALGAVDLRLSAAAKQRLWVCLTDSRGVVWSFPSIQVTTELADFTLLASDVRPDPFQNGGKDVPSEPDWAEMRLLTILDIAGFMGASAVDCAWRVESVRGTEASR